MAESHEEWQPYVYTFGGKRRVVSSRVHCRYHQSGRQFSPRIWRGVYIVGKVLTSFLFRALEDFIYVFIRPFLPGRYGQCGTPLGEVIHRGALFCWFLVLIIIGLPLALLGCILRVVAVSAGKKDFTFVRPATQQPPLLADNDDITITLRTQNIGFLPTVSPANGLATPMKRVRALLADLQSGLDDVVCLQEEFDLDVCDYLLAHLRDSPEDTAPSGDLSLIDEVDAETASLPHNKERSSSFPNNTSPPGKYGWMIMDVDGKAYRLNSGLFVASRYPLEAPEFVRYHVCTNEDVLAGKGVLACTVVVGETSTGQKIKITIFTTHAQAGRQRRAARVRAIQYEMVMHFIDYYNKKHIGPDDILVSSIFMGDFNFSPIMPRPSAITGKLVTCMEWLPNKALFHKHHFMNNFYEHSRDGEKRARNRELIFQIQDLFHAEGARLLLERRTASLPHPGHTSLADLSTASGSGAAAMLHVPLEAKSVGDSSSSGGRLSAGKGDDDEDDGEEEEEDDDDEEEEEEEEEEEGEGGGWSEVMYGGEGSSEASANGQDYRMEREEKIWKMDVATLIRVLQVWAERRAQATKDKPDAVASPAATASDGDGNEGSSSTSESDLEADLTQLIKCELVRQLRVRKKVFVTEDEINVRSIIPLALQLRLVARRSDQSSNNSSSSSGSSNNSSSSRVVATGDRKGKEKAAEDLKGLNRGGVDSGSLDSGEDVEMGSMRKRKRADTGTGIWAGAYEPLIPGTILDTRKYAGKFSQRVRFNDIDHVLMKKHIPGKHVSVTKGRISIVWEGVNTFSDHYGKRLTLSVNVAKLMAKRKRDPSTSPRPDEEEVPLPSGTTVRSSRESEKKNKKKQDRKPPQPAAEADSDST